MASPVGTAAATFDQGFNCSQSVFSTFAGQFGLDRQTALKLAAPFGAGVARRGEICGALTGALLALGLALSSGEPASKQEIYRISQEYLREFEANHASILCRDLIGCDLSSPEGYQQARLAGKFKTVCPELVQEAARLVESFINRYAAICSLKAEPGIDGKAG